MTPTLPRDPLLPHLPLALDSAALLPVFARALPGRLERVRVDRIKYRPRNNLSVSYRLQGLSADGASFDQIVATRWCHGGEAARRHAKAQTRGVTASAAGPGLTHDAALDLVAHWWPNDAKLRAAASLADRERLRQQWLPQAVAALGPAAQPVGEASVALAQVVPEHRVTARIEWTGADGQRRRAYAKADAEQRGPQTHAVMLALARSAAQRSGDLLTPRPLAWQPGSGLHWQCALPGRDLLDHGPHIGVATAARVGALLAALHATPLPDLRSRTLDELRRAPLDVATALVQVDEGFAALVLPLAGELARRVSELALAPMASLHGDLHPRNLLLADDGSLGLIDLDSTTRGPAVLDLGSWLADSAYRAVLADADPADALPAGRAFVESHAAAFGWRASESLLAWVVAYQLLCQRVWRCLVNLKPGRYERIGALLQLATRLLQRAHLDALAGRPTAGDTR